MNPAIILCLRPLVNAMAEDAASAVKTRVRWDCQQSCTIPAADRAATTASARISAAARGSSHPSRAILSRAPDRREAVERR
jgi:hypothetical protein